MIAIDEATIALLNASARRVRLAIHGDDRGSLVSLEKGDNLPFEVRRAYYIFGTKAGVVRGRHAHRTLRQILVAVAGSADVTCEWSGKRETFHLASPTEGLLIEGLVWREMTNFSGDAVLLVAADAPYDEGDYVRDYEKFKAILVALQKEEQ